MHEKKHLLILPEDNVNERIANGFFLMVKFRLANSQIRAGIATKLSLASET
jgi:hypothetical protein